MKLEDRNIRARSSSSFKALEWHNCDILCSWRVVISPIWSLHHKPKYLSLYRLQAHIRFNFVLELERVPDPAQRLGSEEKLVVKKPNTRCYPGPNLSSQARKPFSRLDRARDNAV